MSTTEKEPSMKRVFEARDVSVSYGGVHALRGVDVDVHEGQLVGLIGPNGAGKTTFIDAVTGFTPSGGTVKLDGEDISSMAPHKRSRKGLGRTWQSIELFDDLSIEKNVVVSARRATMLSTIAEIFTGLPDTPEVDRALGLVGLDHQSAVMPDTLSLGQRKLVGVARALVRQPRMLLLDEPAAGLDRSESAELGRQLRKLADDGQAMLLIDHDMGLMLSICDYIVVLNFGELIAQGTPQEVVKDPNVLTAYLGSSAGPPPEELVEEVIQEAQDDLSGDTP